MAKVARCRHPAAGEAGTLVGFSGTPAGDLRLEALDTDAYGLAGLAPVVLVAVRDARPGVDLEHLDGPDHGARLGMEASVSSYPVSSKPSRSGSSGSVVYDDHEFRVLLGW